ncbi:MAG TPA: glycosyltransferase family 39 protein [Oscillatoriaceae cyanobacterium M33_DOE_052]|uniref:Glycosyltransferase RgtA/B/C/D-like domain-containing protein n=1 Tax=Planktothricoides sp. SpSt-374 TaxID=2282167 RepID=A0A7C3ZVD3_9CYAN|nr:glycosyltransferase family 39 protein [Oscillatoriaceae cyanobacterium M33_DOE_052]
MSRLDKVLIFSLGFAFLLCLYGLNWGGSHSWHPDEMAFQTIFRPGELPFNPKWFHKPPFHTYFNFFLSTLPFFIIGKIIPIDPEYINFIQVIKVFWSRLLTVFLFLGSIILVYKITERFFGIFAARCVALVFATSAGLIAFSHFLTTDIPVTFWMLLAFYFAQNILFGGSQRDYILAGLLTGIATATKYNGLAIGIAIVVAHVLSHRHFAWQKLIFSRQLYLGLAAVTLGFIAGNPFAILDYPTFISHFMYNYIVTPVYDGSTGNSYIKFWLCFVEIIGWPSFLLFSLGFGFCFYFLLTGAKYRQEKKALILLLSVFFLYYYKFGSFPRIETRFVLPILPYWMILSGPFWRLLKPTRIFPISLAVILSYNGICGFYVGKRFTEDPRMAALEWVKQNIPPDSYIESTRYSPDWNDKPGVNLKVTRIPHQIAIRDKIFESRLQQNPWVWPILEKDIDRSHIAEQWFTVEALQERNSDYIALNSLYYNRFFTDAGEKYYPYIRDYFQNLLAGKLGYKIGFDADSQPVPQWIYPQHIDSLDNRMTILARE